MSISLELTELEAFRVYDAIDSLLHHTDKLIEEKFREKEKIAKELIGSKIGVKFTIFGTKKTAPFILESVISKIQKLNELNSHIYTLKSNFSSLHSAILKLNIPGYSDSNKLFVIPPDEREKMIWDNLASFFNEFSNGITVKELKDYFYKATQ